MESMDMGYFRHVLNSHSLFLKQHTFTNHLSDTTSSVVVISKNNRIRDLVHLVHSKPNISLPQGLQVSSYTSNKCDEYGLPEDNIDIDFLQSV